MKDDVKSIVEYFQTLIKFKRQRTHYSKKTAFQMSACVSNCQTVTN